MSREVEVRVPDIGDFDAVDVVEILVAPGDRVAIEDPLVSLESDKATMEVPSPVAGEVLAVKVSLGDAVSEGSLLVVMAALDVQPAAQAPAPGPRSERVPAPPPAADADSPPLARFAHPSQPAPLSRQPPQSPQTPRPSRPLEAKPAPVPPAAVPGVDRPVRAHAGPGMRRFARELGVDLAEVEGSGRAGRVIEADLKRHVRSSFESRGLRATVAATPARTADVTELEAFRRRIPLAPGETGPTTLALSLKAALAALRAFPQLAGRAQGGATPGLDPDAMPLTVSVEDATRAAATPVIVPGASSLGLRELARSLDAPAPARDGERADFGLRFEARSGGRPPRPMRTAQMRFALGIGSIEVVPRFTGSTDDALAAEGAASFEPRLVLPIAIDAGPDIDPGVAERFLDHWAEILTAPARLLL